MKKADSRSDAARTYDLGSVEQIPIGEGRLFQAGHIPVAVFRDRQDQVYATQSLCPHKGGLLADGIIGGGQLQCPLHTYKFELANGEPVGNECKALEIYAVQLNGEKHVEITIEKPGSDVE